MKQERLKLACTRRKQCMKKTSGEQFKYYHHPLLNNEGTFNGVAMISGKPTMLLILTADLVGYKNKSTQCNILFDRDA
jgi:hypothetical protein